MSFPLYIAKRYLRSKSSNNAINFITIIAIIGVILGAASLFIVLSGFAGLKDFTLQFSSIADPDLKAETSHGKTFTLTEEDIKKLDAVTVVDSYSKIVESRVLIMSNNKHSFAIIKGVDENFKQIVAVDSILDTGSWLEQNTREIVVGWGLSKTLSLGLLDYTKPLNIYVPKPGKGQITSTKNAFNAEKTNNVGVFYINEDLNDNYIFAPIKLTQNLLNYQQNEVTAIEFKLKPETDTETAKEEIKTILGDKVIVKNREQLNDALYKMLNTENLAVYLIFTLVIIIALFNVIGSLIMMMLDKKQSLSILFNIGATIKDIRRIFFYQGSLISILGGTVGLCLGFLIVFLQKTFHLLMLTDSLAYPVVIKWENFFIAFLTISVLGVIASKIASVRITESLVKNN